VGAKKGELDLLYISCLAALVIGDSGRFALDGPIADAVSNHLRHSKFVAFRDDQDVAARQIGVIVK
jgi:hypothetical protein